MTTIQNLLLHKKVLIRFLTLYALAVVLFLTAWTLSYYLLPEGFLKGRTGTQALAGSEAADTFLLEWLRIFAINLGVGTFFVVALNVIKSPRGYPMGYWIPLAWAMIYAITLGTNSFTFPLPNGPMPPSFSVLTRSGPYEIGAFILAAASTLAFSRYQLWGRWPRQRLDTIAQAKRLPMQKQDWAALVLAFLILAAANAWEAYQIMLRF
jgi:hypothetical protein